MNWCTITKCFKALLHPEKMSNAKKNQNGNFFFLRKLLKWRSVCYVGWYLPKVIRNCSKPLGNFFINSNRLWSQLELILNWSFIIICFTPATGTTVLVSISLFCHYFSILFDFSLCCLKVSYFTHRAPHFLTWLRLPHNSIFHSFVWYHAAHKTEVVSCLIHYLSKTVF